jgi:hypothetical protein
MNLPQDVTVEALAIAVKDSRVETRWSKLEQWLGHP